MAAKNQPPASGQNLPATRQDQPTVLDLLKKNRQALEMALPKHVDADKLIRVAYTAIRKNPLLMQCTQPSLVSAVIECAQLGLLPDGVLGQAYLIPYKNNKKGCYEAQFQVGYKGLIDLARRSGQVVSIQAHVVYEGDEFDFAYGLEDKLYHKPTLGDPGEPIAVYAAAKLTDGGHAFEVMGIEQVNRIRDNSQGYKMAIRYDKMDTPWIAHWDEMARKTAVRRLAKYLPISVEFQRAAAMDERVDAGLPDFDEAPVDVENEAEVAALLERLASACPASYPEPPDPVTLADYIGKTAEANKTTRTAILMDALEDPEGVFVAYHAYLAKQAGGNGSAPPAQAQGDNGLFDQTAS